MVGWIWVTGTAKGGEDGKYRVGVAFGACQPCMCPSQWEFRLRMIKSGRSPTLGGMTSAATVTELPLMSIILGMAAGAILRG